MRRHHLTLAAGVAACLALPAAASAAAPANDAPAGAIAFTSVTAENGTPTEQQGIAELTDATADAGVARCLGTTSFARTVWFRVPAADAVRQVSVTGTGGSGQSAAQPDLAAFVVDAGSTAPTEPQACDGGEVEPAVTGGDPGGAPEVDVRVPAGKELLVQVGRPDGQAPERVVLSKSEAALPAVAAPAGDLAGAGTPALTLGTTVTAALGGATLTAEDPAEPACPGSATVWRRATVAESGTQQVRVAGPAVTAVTAFVGDRPTADNAVSCTQRASADTIALDVPAKRGDTLWVRLGTEATAADALAALRVLGPAAAGGGGTPVTGPGTTIAKGVRVSLALTDRRRKVRLRTSGGGLAKVTVTVQRRRGRSYRTIGTARAGTLTAGKAKTVKLKLKRGASLRPRGRYRFVIRATTRTKPVKRVAQARTTTLKRLS